MNNCDNIDWIETENKFLINNNSKHISNKRVVYKCPICGDKKDLIYKDIKRKKRPECKSCISKQLILSDEAKNKISIKIKNKWNNNEYNYNNMIISNKEFLSKLSKDRWKNKKCAEAMSWRNKDEHTKSKIVNKIRKSCKKQWANEELRKRSSEISKKLWDDKDYRDKISNKIKLKWKEDAYRSKVIEAINSIDVKRKISEASKKNWKDDNFRRKGEEHLLKTRINMPRVSSIQEILYSILDDLNIKYYREHNNKENDKETVIGPYSFDCVVPRDSKPDLLIECQGDYWHSIPSGMIKDKSKLSYINNNFPGKYELKYLWEHEFYNKDKIIELIKYWIGITASNVINFNFNNVQISKPDISACKLLLSKYHYLSSIGRGGIAYGAYLNNELIAVCIFSPLIRQNIAIDDYNKDEIRELSRLCIHPKYQKKNFASWFISRCINNLNNKYRCIISYVDETFNHNGSVYKACGFMHDKILRPDYWYINNDRWVMHKKTLYNRAIKNSMTEKEFADLNGYNRVYGSNKHRYVYRRHK